MTDNVKDGIRRVDTLNCPACEVGIQFIRDVQNPQPVKKGNIVICSNCATVCKVGDSNLVRCAQEEIAAMDEQSRKTIAVLVLGVLQKKAKDNGAKFNPNGKS